MEGRRARPKKLEKIPEEEGPPHDTKVDLQEIAIKFQEMQNQIMQLRTQRNQLAKKYETLTNELALQEKIDYDCTVILKHCREMLNLSKISVAETKALADYTEKQQHANLITIEKSRKTLDLLDADDKELIQQEKKKSTLEKIIDDGTEKKSLLGCQRSRLKREIEKKVSLNAELAAEQKKYQKIMADKEIWQCALHDELLLKKKKLQEDAVETIQSLKIAIEQNQLAKKKLDDQLSPLYVLSQKARIQMVELERKQPDKNLLNIFLPRSPIGGLTTLLTSLSPRLPTTAPKPTPLKKSSSAYPAKSTRLQKSRSAATFFEEKNAFSLKKEKKWVEQYQSEVWQTCQEVKTESLLTDFLEPLYRILSNSAELFVRGTKLRPKALPNMKSIVYAIGNMAANYNKQKYNGGPSEDAVKVIILIEKISNSLEEQFMPEVCQYNEEMIKQKKGVLFAGLSPRTPSPKFI